jgi:hypothetical protein
MLAPSLDISACPISYNITQGFILFYKARTLSLMPLTYDACDFRNAVEILRLHWRKTFELCF